MILLADQIAKQIEAAKVAAQNSQAAAALLANQASTVPNNTQITGSTQTTLANILSGISDVLKGGTTTISNVSTPIPVSAGMSKTTILLLVGAALFVFYNLVKKGKLF